MDLSRRAFCKVCAGFVALGPLGLSGAKVSASETSKQSDVAMLVDVTRCIGCWWCYAACKKYNNVPETIKPDPEQPPDLSPDTWTTLYPVKTGNTWSFRKHACMHCTDAACVRVCPTGALSYDESGFVKYERDKCSGCGYCREYCPFDVPRLETEAVSGVGLMSKCTFCMDRVKDGSQPACAEACPTGAIKFGNRQELLEEAKQRVAGLQETDEKVRLYGEHELGGLHVLYILDDAPEVYGLPENPGFPVLASVQENLFKPYAWAAWGLVALGLALNVMIARARQRRKKEVN